MKKIGVLGGSGFVGFYIINNLLESGYSVKMINRKKSSDRYVKAVEESIIDLKSNFLYKELMDCDSVIYNIGIIREFKSLGVSFKDLHQDLAIHAIKMSEKAKVRKFILMTANGVDRCLTNYEKTKFEAEQYLMKTNLKWTIFRPSVIFGDPKGKMEFCTQIKNDIVKTPLPLPIFFNGINIFNAGKFKMSPIHVRNVAEFFVLAIKEKKSNQKIYTLGGKSYSWIEIVEIISSACGKRKLSIPVSISIMKFIAFLFDRFSWFPVTRDQLIMLSTGNVCDSSKYFAQYGIKEISFDIENLDYLS
tara:strand:+ start:766 stop:1677 length:912 start_codon:yes stop_codon:yes gene_type:complete